MEKEMITEKASGKPEELPMRTYLLSQVMAQMQCSEDYARKELNALPEWAKNMLRQPEVMVDGQPWKVDDIRSIQRDLYKTRQRGNQMAETLRDIAKGLPENARGRVWADEALAAWKEIYE